MAETPTFGRYAEIPVDEMTPEQKEGYQSLLENRGRLPGPNKIWVHNPKLAKVMGPLGAHFRTGYSLNDREREVLTGRYGLRDREHPRAKPPRTLRIAVLGDSYMQAMNVPWPDAFPARLESELRTCLAPVVPEVINFGVSGYVTAQELLTFQLLAADYHPDIVLTAFYAGNDLTDNYGPTADTATPFYALDGDTLSLDTSFRSRVFADQPWRIRVRMALAMSLNARANTLISSWPRTGRLRRCRRPR